MAILAPRIYSIDLTTYDDGRPNVFMPVMWSDGTYGDKGGYTIEYQRQVYPSGAWATVASTSSTAWADFAAPKGRLLRYRVRSKSGGQTSAWSAASAVVAGPPPTATSVKSAWTGEHSVRLSFDLDMDPSYPLDHIFVYTEGDMGYLLAAGERSVEVWRDGAGAWSGRICTYNKTGVSNALDEVETSTAFSVAALRNHGAPRVTLPSTAPLGSPVTVSWVPNAPSGDAQERATVTVDGAAREVDGPATSLSLGQLGRGRHDVSVATFGITGRSDGAGLASVDVYGPPHASIDAVRTTDGMGSPVERVPFHLLFSCADESGVSSASITVHGPFAPDGSAPLVGTYDVIGLITDPTASGEPPMVLPSYDLVVGASGESVPDGKYRATITASSGRGLTSSGTLEFEVRIPPPSIPRYEVEVDGDLLTATVTVHSTRVPRRAERPSGATVASPEGSVPLPWVTGECEPATNFDVWRVYDRYGEVPVLLASGIDDGDSVVDPWPPLNVPFLYRVVGRGDRGGVAVRDCEVVVDSHGAGAINFGDGLSRVALCRYDGEFSRHREPEVLEVSYKGDVDPRTGRVLPHAFPTGELEDTVDVEFILLGPGYERPGIEDHMDALLATLALWRDPFGERWAARVESGEWGDSASDYGATTASASLVRISDDDVAYV